jgi:hypothetical protein
LIVIFAQTLDIFDYPEWINPGMSKDDVLNHFYTQDGVNNNSVLLRDSNTYMISENIFYQFNYNRNSKLDGFDLCLKAFSGEIKDLQTVIDYFTDLIHEPVYLKNSTSVKAFWELGIIDDNDKRYQTFLTVYEKAPLVTIISWDFIL